MISQFWLKTTSHLQLLTLQQAILTLWSSLVISVNFCYPLFSPHNISAEGEVLLHGENEYGQLGHTPLDTFHFSKPPSLAGKKVVKIAAGSYTSIAIVE